MHPIAFVTANTVSFVSSELALREAAASAFTEEQLSSTSPPPNNPLHGVKRSLLEHDERMPGNINSPLHFVFIVHGHQGRPSDLAYLHHTIRAKANEMEKFEDVKSSDSCVVGRINEGRSALNNAGKIRRKKRDRMPISIRAESALDSHAIDEVHASGSLIVHNAACNEGRTHDGIIKGGERLLKEMLSVIRFEVKRREQQLLRQREHTCHLDPVDVTISIVGNSLGGLYARYAIAHLAEVLDSCNNTYLLDGFIFIHFNVFCSTASPHLGCSGFTYIPIPRTAEIGVAQIMGETGSDLFRLNDLIHSMATSPRFLKPLASFKRRIAYANAFGTDFPVPGSTAAFLSKESEYPHYFGEPFMEGDTKHIKKLTCPASERGLFAATLHTMPEDKNFETKTTTDDVTAMSASLDKLGWVKVFVDIRKEIPSLPILKSGGEGCPLSQLKSSSSKVRSCDLDKAISSSSSHRLSLPLGHNAICAFSRGKASSILNSGGRPVMDSLAIDLTDTISLWNGNYRRHVNNG